MDPKEVFFVTVRLIEAASWSDFKTLLSASVECWVHSNWDDVASNRAFALRDPRSNTPAILDAIRSSLGDLASAARIALAAAPAVPVRLHPQVIEHLRRLAE